MITFATQTVTRNVHADQVSRMSLCCCSLWVFAIVFPVLYLVSIGTTSWPSNTYINQAPMLTYKNYQISCQATGNSILYYTDLGNKISLGSNLPIVVAGSSSGSLQDQGILSCTGVLYLDVLLKESIANQFVGMVPFSVSSGTVTTNFLSTAEISYEVGVNSDSALSQNYQRNIQYNSPFKSVYSSMQDNFLSLNSNPLGLFTSNQRVSKQITTSSSIAPTISISLYIPTQRLLVSNSLLNQMRQFFRQWVYIFIPVSWVAIFILRRLTSSRIYPSRTSKAFVKQKVL